MKAADHYRQAGGTELAAEIERAWKLIGLDADQPNEPATGRTNLRNRAFDVDDRVGLVIGIDRNINLGPERLGDRAVGEQPIDARQAGRRYHRAAPLDDIAVGVVMRRLDEHDLEGTPCHPRLAHAVCLRTTTNQQLKAHAKATTQPQPQACLYVFRRAKPTASLEEGCQFQASQLARRTETTLALTALSWRVIASVTSSRRSGSSVLRI